MNFQIYPVELILSSFYSSPPKKGLEVNVMILIFFLTFPPCSKNTPQFYLLRITLKYFLFQLFNQVIRNLFRCVEVAQKFLLY